MAKIYIEKSKYNADFKVFEVSSKYDADLIVYLVDSKYDAKGDEKWFIVDSKYDADKKIFYESSKYNADLKVFFAKTQTSWTASSPSCSITSSINDLQQQHKYHDFNLSNHEWNLKCENKLNRQRKIYHKARKRYSNINIISSITEDD